MTGTELGRAWRGGAAVLVRVASEQSGGRQPARQSSLAHSVQTPDTLQQPTPTLPTRVHCPLDTSAPAPQSNERLQSEIV